ncbi:cyclic peptide export ABC transporter [Azospirillum endophyticum]
MTLPPMTLRPMTLGSILRTRWRRITAGAVLNFGSALAGVAAVALFSHALTAPAMDPRAVDLWQAAGLGLLLIGALFGLGMASQSLIVGAGHAIVHDLRLRLVRRLMATEVETIDGIGSARILSTLTKDVSMISQAFNSLPFVIFGGAVLICGYGYLVWLSAVYALALATVTVLVVFVARRLAVRAKHYRRLARDADTRIHEAFEALIRGRNELRLSRVRRAAFLRDDLQPAVEEARRQESTADLLGVLTSNVVNAAVLLTILVILVLKQGLGVGSLEQAAAATTLILFIRAPLAGLIGSLPHWLAGTVAVRSVESLALATQTAEPSLPPAAADWSRLDLSGLGYRYPARGADAGFAFGPVDLSVAQGELVFIIGGNGSGKSTFARLVAGLYPPQQGSIRFAGRSITASERDWYRQHVAVILSDFHLFQQALAADGEAPSTEAADRLLRLLALDGKVRLTDGAWSTVSLSQGQRKRLALIAAILENKSILILDEWAADQDPDFRRIFYMGILPLLKDQGKTIIAITHDDHYFDVADSLYKMENGALTRIHGGGDLRSPMSFQREKGG